MKDRPTLMYALIALAVVIVLLVIGIVIVVICNKKRKARQEAEELERLAKLEAAKSTNVTIRPETVRRSPHTSVIVTVNINTPRHYTGYVGMPNGRRAVGLTLDTENVKKVYRVGNEFCADGLVVTAHFDKAPFTEVVKDYVIQPVNMSQTGVTDVIVTYGGVSDGFSITVNPQPKRATQEEIDEVLRRSAEYDKCSNRKKIYKKSKEDNLFA